MSQLPRQVAERPTPNGEASAAVKLRRVADRRDAMICMARHEGWGADGRTHPFRFGRSDDHGNRQGQHS